MFRARLRLRSRRVQRRQPVIRPRQAPAAIRVQPDPRDRSATFGLLRADPGRRSSAGRTQRDRLSKYAAALRENVRPGIAENSISRAADSTIARMAVRSLPRARRDLRPALRDSVAGPVVKWVGGK